MAHVKLILLQDIESLGLAGTEVSVAPGYARNYLIPRGLAAKAAPGVLRVIAANREKIEARRQEELAAAQALAAKLMDLTLNIAMQASEDNQLFGSVTARNVADALNKEGLAVDHQRVVLETPIKMLGEYEVTVKLHHDVTANVKIHVVRA